MLWDKYDYLIGSHFLSALIYGDESGLSDEDSAALTAFEREAHRIANESGFTPMHWDADADDEFNFARCDVTGLASDVRDVRLMITKG